MNMKKTIAGFVAVAALATPVAVFADNGQLVALYQQLIQVLQQQINLLKQGTVTVSPQSGKAPLEVAFTVVDPIGSEAIDFGDGHSTGSDGCEKNAKGFCDLSKSVSHTYQLPGTYKVTLYRGTGKDATIVGTQTVTVQ
jgi:hypothetical protein